MEGAALLAKLKRRLVAFVEQILDPPEHHDIRADRIGRAQIDEGISFQPADIAGIVERNCSHS